MKKKFKAIFGNPPYSMKSGEKTMEKKNLWNTFSETSMEAADEVYYITPHIWNGAADKFMKFADGKINYVDLTTGNQFEVYSPICYWNNHKADKMRIETENKMIEVETMSEIKYIPAFIDETLSIHKKGWLKDKMGFRNDRVDMLQLKYSGDMKKVKDDEFKFPVFSTSINSIQYANEKGWNLYRNYYKTPKLMIGMTNDNRPFIDRNGDYGVTHMALCLFDTIENLEIREKQLNSNFAKFWFLTGRKEIRGNLSAIMYNKVLRDFPNIPLNITTDAEIHAWLGLSDDEVEVVEKYAAIATESDNKRKERYEKKV